VEGFTVDGGGGLRVGAGEEKVRDSVLVLRLTFVGTCSLFMDSDQTFHAFVLEYIRLADRPRFLVDAGSQRTMEAGSIGSEWLQCPAFLSYPSDVQQQASRPPGSAVAVQGSEKPFFASRSRSVLAQIYESLFQKYLGATAHLGNS
jgi:hypothetical protein